MTVRLASSIIELVLGMSLGPSSEAAVRNRCSLEGVTWEPGQDGDVKVGIRNFEATALRISCGALVLEIGRMVVRGGAGQVRAEAGGLHLSSVEAIEAELSGVKLSGPLVMPVEVQKVRDALPVAGGVAFSAGRAAPHAVPDVPSLGPLAQADGTIRGQITDAHLLFDAEVTVPIRQGQIDFNDATVEHVGPDSRMGVSRMGIYVDAPNGRSYVYQFPSAPLGGVEFERRGALLGPWVSERGKLRLQEFAEAMLRQSGGASQGLTEQARLLLGRTALSGEVQLGDAPFAVPGLQAHMEGRRDGRNALVLRSEALGEGLTVEMPSMSARDAMATWASFQLGCSAITARLKLQLTVDGSRLRFALEIENCKVAAPRLQRRELA
ncbi:hypothetical protein QTI24_26865 [Variovorax sp. J22P240]|uniref:hypothetical protein n=1 Tax=Variovorax sp. J22P240 TaxID=3053514 RepID=UPI0025764C21|nr:hypothetical protein [Variovorax sp. J22P240]MDM0002253.1 hypothetical protein [Variovorax sp. J22P240]